MPVAAGAFRTMVGLIATRFMIARYALASICALASDMLVFLALGHLGMPPVVAALGGYLLGMAVHWIVSTRYVFLSGDAERATHIQRIGFVLSAVFGLGMTMAVVGALSAAGASPAIAKVVSVPFSFFSIYAIRKYGVFAAR